MDVECLEGRNRFRNEEIRVPNGNFASKEQEALLKQESLLKDTCMKNFQCFVKGEIPPFGKMSDILRAGQAVVVMQSRILIGQSWTNRSKDQKKKLSLINISLISLIFVKTLNSIQHHQYFFKADAMNPNESVLLIS
jgi:hypothetical protein